MPYTVRVDYNFRYMDETARYTHVECTTWEEALKAAQAIVDVFLSSAYTPGMTADVLYQIYTSFGEDPFIIGPGEETFSAWDSAKARIGVICEQPRQ